MKARTSRFAKGCATLAAMVVSTFLISLAAAPQARAEELGAPCSNAGQRGVMMAPEPTGPIHLLCWYYPVGNQLLWIQWSENLPVPPRELVEQLAKTNKIGQPCGAGIEDRLECRGGLWRSRRTVQPVRTRDRCLIGRWLAPVDRTAVLLSQLIPPMGEGAVILQGDLLMHFDNSGYWGYSSANLHFQSVRATDSGGPKNYRFSIFLDGSFGTRNGRVLSTSMTGQHTLEKVWDEKVSLEPMQLLTYPVANGAMPYRCTRSTLRITIRPGITLTLDRQA